MFELVFFTLWGRWWWFPLLQGCISSYKQQSLVFSSSCLNPHEHSHHPQPTHSSHVPNPDFKSDTSYKVNERLHLQKKCSNFQIRPVYKSIWSEASLPVGSFAHSVRNQIFSCLLTLYWCCEIKFNMYFLWNLQFKQLQIKLYNLKDKGSVRHWQLTMILFQMEEVGGVSFGITDNIHLKEHAHLISSHDGKAKRGQNILDQKGRTGWNNGR